MKRLYQPESGVLTVRYMPDETTELLENPPRFTWMPAIMEGGRYCIQISSTENFSESDTETVAPVYSNFYTPNRPMKPGKYYWRYALLEKEDGNTRSEWSIIRSFVINVNLPETPLPARDERYKGFKPSHPRLWLNAEELEKFRSSVREDPQYCSWQHFFDESVVPWLGSELQKEPEPYPNNQRVTGLWRAMYMACQEVLCAVRHLSIAGMVLKDESILQKAKQYLLHVAAWDTEGTTSRNYNDESAFRIAAALAWGYDWLYDQLSEEERKQVLSSLFRRTEQVAVHVIVNSKIHYSLYDSHAVRSLSSVLTPCCIAMLEEVSQAKEWLDYTLEYFACLYTPWGGKDGGWAEGGMYWTTGMAFVTEAMNLIRKFLNIDYYRRPFFQRTGDFPLYCYSQDTLRASFCDQSELGNKPGLKTGFNIRQFAGVTGNGYYQWYFEKVKERNQVIDQSFFNKGWWDFYFDEMLYKHDFLQVKAVPPDDIPVVKWFRDVGWIAFHHRMEVSEEHIMLLTKSSPYGSVSHSHGDQGSFLIHAYGEPLAIESGYYVGFGTTMHMNWRRRTKSQNNLLIDGIGQYAGKDKTLQLAAKGVVECVESCDTFCYVRENITAAYLNNVSYLKNYVREIYFVNRSYFVIVDSVDLNKPARVDWLIHALKPMEISGQSFRITGDKANLEGTFVYCSSSELTLTQNDEFPEVDPKEYEGLPKQWHMTASTKKAEKHRLVTMLLPFKKGDYRYVSSILDDQGHDISIYFTGDGNTFRVNLRKYQ